jgi:hypothetical protein
VEPAEINSNSPAPPPEPSASPITPAWHTFVLVAAIVALSIHSAGRLSANHGPLDRLATYGFSAAMEIVMLAWVILGLRLNKVPLRSLLGSFSLDARSIATDFGFALVFWICSLVVLGTLGVAWSGVDAALSHRHAASHAAPQTEQAGQAERAEQTFASDPEQIERLRALAQLAPANGREIAAWMLLCLLVGFIEEIVFRGYLQRQFIGWARGRVAAGVLASAIVFGSAHAYQGKRHFLAALFWGCSGFKLDSWWLCGHGGLGWMKG